MTKIRYSPDVDVLLIELSDKAVEYAEEAGQLVVHFSKKGEPVLLEVMDAKEFILNSLSCLIKGSEVTLT